MTSLPLRKQIYTEVGCMLSSIIVVVVVVVVLGALIGIGVKSYKQRQEQHERMREWMRQVKKNSRG
jgi:hypothetical protein